MCKNFFNFTDVTLPHSFLEILNLSAKFIPTPINLTPNTIREHIQHFNFKFNRTKSLINTSYTNNVLDMIHSHNLKLNFNDKMMFNDPKHTRTTTKMKNNKTIIFTYADKNLGLVALDTIDYITKNTIFLEDKRHFNMIPTNIVSRTMMDVYERVNNHIHKFKIKITLSITDESTKFPFMYFLPKIHKLNDLIYNKKIGKTLSYRPIVGSYNCATTNLSTYINTLLIDVINNLPNKKFILLNSDSLLRTFHTANNLQISDPTTVISTADIQSLYTNIDVNNAIELISSHLKRIKHPLTQLIIESLAIIFNNNYFTFNSITYHQILGIAMGTNVAPTFANLYLYLLEEQRKLHKLLNYFNLPYYRYLDDILLIAPEAMTKIIDERYLNKLHHNLIIDLIYSPNSQNFLDIKINLYKKPLDTYFNINTEVFQKNSNLYDYTPFDSYTPFKIHKNLIIGEVIRYMKVSSDITVFEKILDLFKKRLLNKKFPLTLINNTFNRLPYSKRMYYLFRPTENNKPSNYTKFPYNPSTDSDFLNILLNHSLINNSLPLTTINNSKAVNTGQLINNHLLQQLNPT